MNVDRGAQGLTVLLVLACAVVHTSCKRVDADVSNGAKAKANSGNNAKDDRQPDRELENMLQSVATVIQKSIDEKTMNNKDFKLKLDNLYKNVVKPKINKAMEENLDRYEDIKKLYEEKRLMLMIMNGEQKDKKVNLNPKSK